MDISIKKSSSNFSQLSDNLRNDIHNKIVYKPIGIIHSPFKELSKIPQQPEGGRYIEGFIELFPEYVEGLVDIDMYTFITLIYDLHLSKGYNLQITNLGEGISRGIFSTRAPSRPNSIGISVVRLNRIEGSKIYIRDLDMIDGTPLLDIKPYKTKDY
jgi:tRNA-Thr(GGU) m(6)t(6)A37 methyltransferase TsaA